MVRVITNDELCCEIKLNAASYNLIKLSCDKLNTNFSPNITSIDLSARTKNGDMIKSLLDVHEFNENAHKALFNKKANTSDLSTVAMSGNYNDLSNRPVIPTVSEICNATITITQGGINKGTFTANASSDVTIDIDDISDELSGKADVDLSNVNLTSTFATSLNTAGISTVVETYSSGTSWYRVYSDGWCEQGGEVVYNSGTGGTVTLLKAYKDTAYIVTTGMQTVATGHSVSVNSLTQSSFGWLKSHTGVGLFWQTAGYIN